jgi:DNA-binding FadR family transcriptional regulator
MTLQPHSKPDVPTGRPAPDRGYLRLAAQIHALVAQGEFAVGQRLPAERALAERFDVSRTSVREAIIALELQGVVEVRGGSGIYVCEPGAVGQVAMQEPGAGPFELLRARCLVESEIAAMAASTRTDADLDRIFEALTAMRDRMTDKDANAEADRRFHLCIAQSTGNSVLLATVTSMWDQARGPIWQKMEQHFHTQALRQASQADHQRIFSALVARDAPAARQAMRDHLERVIGEFAQGWR